MYAFAGYKFTDRSEAIARLAVAFMRHSPLSSHKQIAEWLADPDFTNSCAAEMLANWDCNISATDEPEYPTESELAGAIACLNPSDFA